MNKQPLFSSMHTHSTFCDGKDDVETMCQAAYQKNLYAIGFSAHAPVEKQIGRKTHWHLKDENVIEYAEEVQKAKKRWEGKLKVFLGYELDYIKGVRSPFDKDITALNLDYIIGSTHYLVPRNGSEPFTVDGPMEEFEKGLKEGYNNDPQALMHAYYDSLAEMIKEGGFDILAHADLIKKNTFGKNYWPQEIELSRQMEIANLIASFAQKTCASTEGASTQHLNALVVEVNTGGINRKKINETYPSLTFLRFIHKCNIPVIITSDAHNANDINGNFDTALDTLKSIGFNKHFLFNGKNNNISVWQEEKIS